jgi:phosphomannomutase
MTRDSVLPILSALLSAASAGTSLANLVDALHLPFATSERLQDVPTAKSSALVNQLISDAPARAAFLEGIGTETAIDLTDGLRVTLAEGATVHLRPSGNAPEMRCYADAATEAETRALLARLAAKLRLLLV